MKNAVQRALADLAPGVCMPQQVVAADVAAVLFAALNPVRGA